MSNERVRVRKARADHLADTSGRNQGALLPLFAEEQRKAAKAS
jgi:hypothetical protein